MNSAKKEPITVLSDDGAIELEIEAPSKKRHDEASGVVSQSQLEIVGLIADPDESALESVSAVLSGYPEVESAVFAMTQRGAAPPEPLLSICIHRDFRRRTVEILDRVRQASAAAGLQASVLLLQKSQVAALQQNGVVFFPWRRRGSKTR